MELKLFKCMHCGNIVEMIDDHGVPIMCCGEAMHRLAPGEVDAATEKHVPAVTVSGATVAVQIGDTIHPMLEEHHIEWITLVTDKGIYRRALPHTGEPKAVFTLADEKPVAAYEYCNLHGLWKKDL